MSKGPSRQLKIGLSIIILFQVMAVSILPNPDSILYRNFHTVFGNYGNLFGFNTTWRFFSPNPLVRLMEYEVITKNIDAEAKVYSYPKSFKEEKFREIYNRKLNNSMFMMMRPDILKETLGKKFCQWHPEASEIAIYMRGREASSIEKSRVMGVQKVEDIGPMNRWHLIDLSCSELLGSVKDEEEVQ